MTLLAHASYLSIFGLGLFVWNGIAFAAADRYPVLAKAEIPIGLIVFIVCCAAMFIGGYNLGYSEQRANSLSAVEQIKEK